MKGAEVTSGIRYPFTIAMTFQDSERTVTTEENATEAGKTLPYNPRTNLLCINWCRNK